MSFFIGSRKCALMMDDLCEKYNNILFVHQNRTKYRRIINCTHMHSKLKARNDK